MGSARVLLQGKLEDAWATAVLLLPNVVAGAVVLVVFTGLSWLAARLVSRALHARGQLDLGSLLGGFARWATIGLGLLIAATIVFPSVKPSDALATLGFGSVAVGFAFKDILQNWFAGLLLLLREPFKRGDQIIVAGFEGTVERIQARATCIKTYDGRRVVIPNSDIYTQPVTVNTAFGSLRSSYDVGIGYSDDVANARNIILDAIKSLKGIHASPAPEVIPWDLAGSSVNLRVRWWTDAVRIEVVRARGRVIAAVHDALNAAQIDMPYPTQVVLFHDQTETGDGDRTRQREGWPAGTQPQRSRAAARSRPAGNGRSTIGGGGEFVTSEGEL